MPTPQTRRRFLTTLSLAGAASLIHASPALAAEGQPETTAVRMVRDPGICLAPQYAAEELLRVEGLTEIRYLEAASDADTAQIIARGEGDFTLNFASQFVAAIDRGAPITVLAGVRVGCFELFASSAIRGIADLRGKSVGAQSLGSSAQVFLGALAAGIGLDPLRDIHWVTDPAEKPLELFAAGKIDAYLGVPPDPQELRARGDASPTATIMPADAERRSYDKWREYDAEDTIRFYTLRLHDADLIKSTPQKIIAENTDWRFFNELKCELKA